MSITIDKKLDFLTRNLSIILDVPDFDAIKFAKWLKQTRENYRPKLTVTDLAEKAGVSKQYISLLEKGDNQLLTNKPVQPALDKVEKLAKALDVNLNLARAMAGYDPINIDETTGWFKGLEKLSPVDQKRAKKQIRAIIDSYSDEPETDEDFDYI